VEHRIHLPLVDARPISMPGCIRCRLSNCASARPARRRNDRKSAPRQSPRSGRALLAVEKNDALATFSTALAKSASASTMVGFLRPFRVESAGAAPRPARAVCGDSHEPVKETALTAGPRPARGPGWPRPGDEIHYALRHAASWHASIILQALSGATEAGFSTTVLPQISAGASFQPESRWENSMA